MVCGHLMDRYSSRGVGRGRGLGASRRPSGCVEHLRSMETSTPVPDVIEPVLTLSELAASLAVNVQTLYDLRSKGQGPRGFRVGRELRFRRSEVDSWLARLEAADAARHPARSSR